MFTIIAGVVVAIAAALLFISTYKVTEPNEAHVVVIMGSGRRFYGSAAGKKSAYFFVPVIMKRYILPLTNVKMNIEDIELNDNNVAPFICDVITWVRIQDPIMAAERLNLSEGAFRSLNQDLVNIVQAIARAAAMKQEILDIMKDRKTFSKSVADEVKPVLAEWGVELVNLEVNEIRDTQNSTVIADYESIREAQIRTKARIEIAERDKEATVAEQANFKESQIATAVAQEASEKRFAEKAQVVGIATKRQEQEIARAEELANKQKVEATRTLEVGNAAVHKQATIEVATGEAEAVRIKGEKEANVIKLKGDAEGSAIKAKGLAEAEAKDKMAEALQKFNDAATGIEKINAWARVQEAFALAYGQMAENANIKIVTSGEGGNLFGLPLNAKTGGDIGQMIEALGSDVVGGLIEKVTGKK